MKYQVSKKLVMKNQKNMDSKKFIHWENIRGK